MSRKKPSSRCYGSQIKVSPVSLYLHLPFCLRKCAYCDFASVALDDAGGMPAARRYLEALFVELDRRAMSEEFYGAPVRTVYLGGGTPTVLPAEWIAELLTRLRHRFAFEPEAEITIEANPGTVDEEKIAALLAAGVNRLSIGVQSFSDEVLRTLDRVHSAADALAAIEAARTAGCTNLSLDLMFGIPEQSRQQWRDTLRQTLEATSEHISLYALSVEPGTPMERCISTGDLPAPDDDLAADMYELACNTLSEVGFNHYEISNFARPGMECRHNRRYWASDEYLGIGVSAHSFRGGIRWKNHVDIGVYVEGIEGGILPVIRAETLSVRERIGEVLMLGLRCAEGVSEDDISARFGVAPRDAFPGIIERLCEEGALVEESGRLRIPRSKWLLSNAILSQFVL